MSDPASAAMIGASSGAMGIAGTFLSNQQSAQQAQRQMDFQREMSNTAHQREVEDLRKAGLNPILSALGQGASTPAGAAGSMNDFGPGISKGFDTAIAVRGMQKELQMKDASIGNLDADTGNKSAERNLINAQAHNSAIDAKMKGLQSDILEKTLPSVIQKAKAEGDYSELNQIMGLINTGASSASQILGIGNVFKGLFNKFNKTTGKKP